MAAQAIHSEGIILASTKLKETDAILTLLLKNGEQCRAVCHGARKPGGKFGARAQVFTCADFLIRPGRNLDTIGEISTLASNAGLRCDLEYSNLAYIVCSFAIQLSYQDALNAQMYEMTKKALTFLDEYASLKKEADLLVAAYIFKLFAMHGLMPEMNNCVMCSESFEDIFSLNPEAKLWFGPHAGGFVCNSCSYLLLGAHLVPNTLREWLSALIYSSFEEISDFEVHEEISEALFKAAFWWTREHLDTRIKALEFYIEQKD